MSGECDDCGDHTLDCRCKKRSKLDAFNEKGLIGSLNTECHIRGCRNLETICKDCGRVVCTKELNDGWISCKERLPVPGTYIILYHEKIGCCPGYFAMFNEFYRFLFGNEYCELCKSVEKWMPLPQPPKE